MSDPKDNSGGSVAANELKLLVERVERINEEIGELQKDRHDVFAEAKARGFDPRTMRKVIAIRKIERQAFEEQRALEDTYLAALGIM